jgi:thiol-disulfide isomerase/thioredoxin
MKYLIKPIFYLEKSDFDNNGNIINNKLNSNKPIFIMIQASWCFHCSNSKPEYQKFANKNNDRAFITTIEVDNDKSKNIDLTKIYPDLKGFPSYIVYYKNNKIPFTTGRSEKDLTEFLDRLLV